MADIPKFPEDENLDTLREYKSIQHDIAESEKANLDILKQKVTVTRSVQQLIMSEHIKNKQYNLENVKDFERLLVLSKKVTTTGAEAVTLKHEKQSLINEIALRRVKTKISQMEQELAIRADIERQEESKKWVNIMTRGLKEITGLEGKEFSLVQTIGDGLMENGIESLFMAYSIGTVVMMLKGAFDLFKKMDTAALQFRKKMGMTRVESQVIRKDAEGLAIQYMSMGVTIEGMYKSSDIPS